MRRTMTMAALAVALAAGPAAAHEKGGRAMGVVESVTAEEIVIRTADGHPVAFALGPATRFTLGGKPARAGDVRVGQRASVHGKKAGDRLEAVQVKLGGT